MMIDRDDVLEICSFNNVVVSSNLLKGNKYSMVPYLDRIINLLNDRLLIGSKDVFISKDEFINYLGDTFYRRFLFAGDFDLNTNLDFIDDKRIHKQINNTASLMKLLFFRVKRGKKYKHDITKSIYRINPQILHLYNERLNDISNKKYLKSLYESKLSTKNKDKIIVDTVKIQLDKSSLKKYFLENCKNYQLDTMKLNNPYRTLDSLKDERSSFIGAYAYLYEYLHSRNKSIEIEYTQSGSGRYYSYLGQLDKRVRNHILKDYIEIDLDAAAPNCLYETYKSLTDKELPFVHEIIHSKKQVRSYIGKLLFMDNKKIPKSTKIKYAKKFLTSLFFGSNPSFVGKNATNEIIKEVSEIGNFNYKRTKKMFYNDKVIQNIITEVSELMDTVDEYLQDKTDKNMMNVNGNIINVTPKPGKRKKNTRLAYYYQNWESRFLDEEIKILHKLGIKNNYLKLHDAIYIHIDEFKKRDITEQKLRDKFKKIRVKGNEFNIKPLL